MDGGLEPWRIPQMTTSAIVDELLKIPVKDAGTVFSEDEAYWIKDHYPWIPEWYLTVMRSHRLGKLSYFTNTGSRGSAGADLSIGWLSGDQWIDEARYPRAGVPLLMRYLPFAVSVDGGGNVWCFGRYNHVPCVMEIYHDALSDYGVGSNNWHRVHYDNITEFVSGLRDPT